MNASPALEELILRGIRFIEDSLSVFFSILYKHGEVKAINNNDFEGKNIFIYSWHDFLYYCLTKSFRSLSSALVLIQNNYKEDSLIILRSVYENYLSIAYTLNNPTSIDEFVFQKVGLTTGLYEFRKTKTNRTDYRNVILKGSNKSFKYNTSYEYMSKDTLHNIDQEIHSILYRYLSEHSHPNILGSGNYRKEDNKWYELKSSITYIEPIYFANYLVYILFNELIIIHSSRIVDMEKLSDDNKLIIESLMDSINKYIVDSGNVVELYSRIEGLHDLIKQRIKDTRI